MEPMPQKPPAGEAIGRGPQSGIQRAPSLGSSSMMKEEPRALGGFSPKGPRPKEVHSPRDPKGREQAVPAALNPNPDKQSAHTETQVMSPPHTSTSTDSVAGSVGGGWVQVHDQKVSRGSAKALERGARQELRPPGPSSESLFAHDGHAVQVLKGIPSWKPVAPGGQGSPERRFVGTSATARGSGQKST